VQGKVAKTFNCTSGRPALELAAAAIHGTGGNSALGTARGRAVPLLWAARELASDHMVPTAASRDTSCPREERTAGDNTERTGGPLGAFAGRSARGARRRGDFEDASVCVWPGEGAARDPEAEARAAGAGTRATSQRGAAGPKRCRCTPV
jgi:hypothetical protein